eukprot:7659506-Alexandrium_andersonii.AAC.1
MADGLAVISHPMALHCFCTIGMCLAAMACSWMTVTVAPPLHTCPKCGRRAVTLMVRSTLCLGTEERSPAAPPS